MLYRLLHRKLKDAWLKRHPLWRHLNNKMSPTNVNRQTAVSGNDKFVYVRFPKCANSTILHTLVSMDPSKNYDQYKSGTHLKNNAYLTINKFNNDLCKKIIDDWFWFCFIRNPYERALSAYLNKIKNQTYYKKLLCDYYSKSIVENISFYEYLMFLESGGLVHDLHSAPQVWISPVPMERYNFVGRVENLYSDLGALVNKIFNKRCELISVDDHKTESDKHLHEYYDSREIHLVRKLYHDDFCQLGYSLEL